MEKLLAPTEKDCQIAFHLVLKSHNCPLLFIHLGLLFEDVVWETGHTNYNFVCTGDQTNLRDCQWWYSRLDVALVVTTFFFKFCIDLLIQKMQEGNEDAYLDSPWADSSQLKSQLQGINNVKWGPRWAWPKPDLTYDLTCMIWSNIHQSQSDFYHVILGQTTVILFQFRKCDAGRYSGFQFYATGIYGTNNFGPFSYTMTEATNSWFENWNDLWQASLGHYLCYKAEVIISKVLCKRMP